MRMDTLQPQDVPDAPAPNGSVSVSSESIVVGSPLASPMRIASRLAGPEAGGPLAAPVIAQRAYRSTQYVPNFDAKQAFKQLKPVECDVKILDATNTERASHELITADAGVHVVEIAMLQLQ